MEDFPAPKNCLQVYLIQCLPCSTPSTKPHFRGVHHPTKGVQTFKAGTRAVHGSFPGKDSLLKLRVN